MNDLREYRFGDWISIFLNALPALWIAQLLIAVVVALPIALLLVLVWMFGHA